MITKISDSSNILTNHSVLRLVPTDDVSGDNLLLVVGFINDNYFYCFRLLDKNGNNKIDLILDKRVASKFIPKNIDKLLIINTIKEMTRFLLNNHLPDTIYRRTYEIINSDSMNRYEEITNIMVDEFGYVVTKEEVDQDGYKTWELKRESVNEINSDLNDIYYITNKKTFVEDIRKHLNNIPKEYYIKAIKNGDNKI